MHQSMKHKPIKQYLLLALISFHTLVEYNDPVPGGMPVNLFNYTHKIMNQSFCKVCQLEEEKS